MRKSGTSLFYLKENEVDITSALEQLNLEDDSQWTSDGLPKIDVMRELTGDKDLTRKQLTEAAPQFTRDTASKEPEPEQDIEANPTDLIKSLDVKIADLMVQRDDIDNEINKLSIERDSFQETKFRDSSSKAGMQGRLDYIAQQNKTREEKALRGRRFLESGIRISDIDPRSDIDKSFSRHTKRGTKRPVRPATTIKQE